MPDWSLLGDGQRFEANAGDGDVQGTYITSDVAHTKGGYAQLIASTAFAASGIAIEMIPYDAVPMLLDIAVGGAGSEQVIIPDLLNDNQAYVGWCAYFPIRIPAGSRLSARMQAASDYKNARVMVQLVAQGFVASSPLNRVKAYGITSATSKGIVVDPGATQYAKGAWHEFTAATAAPMKQLLMAVGRNYNALLTTTAWFFDIGIGGAGSEVILIPDIYVIASATPDTVDPTIFGPVPVNVPSGTRLAVRSACRITDATDRLLNVALYGID